MVNGLCHRITDGNGWTARGWKVALGWGRVSVLTGLRPSLRSQRKALGGCGGQRTLSRNHGRERMDGAHVEDRFGVGRVSRFDAATPLPAVATQGFGRVWRPTDSVTESRTKPDRWHAGGRSLRGGGCEAVRFDRLNARLWEGCGSQRTLSPRPNTAGQAQSRTGTDGRRANNTKTGRGKRG